MAATKVQTLQPVERQIREVVDTFNQLLGHVLRTILFVRPMCSHRCVSRKKSLVSAVLKLKHVTKSQPKQTSLRTKWFKHIVIDFVQDHVLTFSDNPQWLGWWSCVGRCRRNLDYDDYDCYQKGCQPKIAFGELPF